MSYLDTHNLHPNQILQSLGLTRTPPSAMAAAVVPATLFGVGLLVGAGVALMLAPKSGRELRRDLGRQANRIGESVRDRMPSLPNRDREMVDNNLASS